MISETFLRNHDERTVNGRRVKQVILVRTDLHMPTGKLAAQVAHAAMRNLSEKVNGKSVPCLDEAEEAWYHGSFRKIVLAVKDEAELRRYMTQASGAGLRVETVVDNGDTVFNGVKTLTCIAIGPNFDDEINPITSRLKPL